MSDSVPDEVAAIMALHDDAARHFDWEMGEEKRTALLLRVIGLYARAFNEGWDEAHIELSRSQNGNSVGTQQTTSPDLSKT